MTKLSLHDGTIVPSQFNITCAYAWLRDQYGCMAKRLKTIVTGVWVVLLLPMLATIFEKWLEQNFFSEPDAAATTVFNNLVMLGQESWFHFALVFFTGIVIGFSLDWLAHRSDENKASELRHLGTNFRRLSDSIKTQASARSEWPDNIRDLRPDIVSAFISAEKFGLWVPGERAYQLPDASFLCEYLRDIGRLLEDGHSDAASREALAWKRYFDKAKTG